jgi:Icc-related predicted phosphoesterase
MPKIHIRSDTHHECNFDNCVSAPIPKAADIIILAGDIDRGTSGIEWASTLNKPVLYVSGNHELFKSNIDTMEYEMRTAAKTTKNVHFLQNDTHIIDNIRFLGTTLWTDYNLFGNSAIAKSYADFSLADHRLISKGYAGLRSLLSPDDAQKMHNRSKYWLINQLSKPWQGKTVVITHHAPHENSVHTKFASNPLTPAFASDLSDVISSFDIDLWVHGHMHDAVDYTIHGTRVVCNPLGYPATSEQDDFKPELIIEIKL